MMKLMPLIAALVFSATTGLAESHAQAEGGQTEEVPKAVDETPKGVFDTYAELRVELDGLIMSRQISALMLEFGAGDEMTPEELADLEAQVQRIYKTDFKTVDLMRRQELENGWRQELLVYSVGLDYIYAYVLLHKRAEDMVAVNFRFNSQFHELNALF